MNTQEVANRLIELCREGKNIDAINELYAENVVSVEPPGAPVEMVQGRDACVAKNEEWNKMVAEVHSAEISEPVVTGDHFAMRYYMDVTGANGQRWPMEELAVYQVKDGKIAREQFFFQPPPQN